MEGWDDEGERVGISVCILVGVNDDPIGDRDGTDVGDDDVGIEVGIEDDISVGAYDSRTVGFEEGWLESFIVGNNVGLDEGIFDLVDDGCRVSWFMDGLLDAFLVGLEDGIFDNDNDGLMVGLTVGDVEGVIEGIIDGISVGDVVGDIEGNEEGIKLGSFDGLFDGPFEGSFVGSTHRHFPIDRCWKDAHDSTLWS